MASPVCPAPSGAGSAAGRAVAAGEEAVWGGQCPWEAARVSGAVWGELSPPRQLWGQRAGS